ncbi:MAG TPA: MerR family transcriptional regulator [Pseudonocardiaceae bacterium]|nr:MerR family transcriptional regulator [Pseudonocardiaceae bacterium]
MQLTIAELAAQTGISVRTIRFYAGMGLIPPPEVRGRLGLYDDRHVARLELVRDLQGLGFTLSAIEGYLARIPMGCTPEDLALHRALLAPWLPEDPEPIDRAELDTRAGRAVTDHELDRLVALGVVHRLPDGQLQLTSSDMLTYGMGLVDAGMGFDVQLASKEIIEQHTSALAADLVALFRNSVLRDYRDAGRPPDQRDQLIALTEQIKPLTVQGVVTHFRLAVNRAIRESVPEGASMPEAVQPARAVQTGSPS